MNNLWSYLQGLSLTTTNGEDMYYKVPGSFSVFTLPTLLMMTCQQSRLSHSSRKWS